MKKNLFRLAALAMVLVLCIVLIPVAYATEAAEDPSAESLPQQNEEPEEAGIDWSFWFTAVILGIACILHTRNQIRRREQRR